MESIPLLSEDLIEELEHLYPPINASDVMAFDDKRLANIAGQRSVVEFLQMRLTQQKEDPNVYT